MLKHKNIIEIIIQIKKKITGEQTLQYFFIILNFNRTFILIIKKNDDNVTMRNELAACLELDAFKMNFFVA